MALWRMERLVSVVEPFSPRDVRFVVKWRYPPPYNVYDIRRSRRVREELLGGSYYAARNKNGLLVGFYCYGRPAQIPYGRDIGIYQSDFLDFGLALRPELTSRGIGEQFVQAGVSFARERYRTRNYRLSVRTFNQRAIVVYMRCGFHRVTSFTTDDTDRSFHIMTRTDLP